MRQPFFLVERKVFLFQVSGFKLNVKGKLILKTETLTQNVRLSEVEALLNKPAFDSAQGDTKKTKTETPNCQANRSRNVLRNLQFY
ncbi:hypothetical protein AB674_15465 [Flavobacterium sp. ABG]|nr:hypothetical protein AB674_15465 [Flavobacterium sp. ABG]